MTSEEAFNKWWESVIDTEFTTIKAPSVENVAKAAWQAALEYAKSKQDPASWANAPEWAMFKAQDNSGMICWYEIKPVPQCLVWTPLSGRFKVACVEHSDTPDWHETLEERPK